MQNATYLLTDRKLGRRFLAVVTTLALLLLSSPNALMQGSADGVTRRLRPSGGSKKEIIMIPLKLEPISDSSTGGTGCTNVLVDGGFEAGGIPSTFWNPETSTNFGTPLCDAPSCCIGPCAAGIGPRTGSFWSWFGGIDFPETATLGQTVTITAGSSATLNFWLKIQGVSAPFTDVLNIRIDGNPIPIQSFPEPTVAESAYTARTINLNAFADGGSHQILFEYIGPSTGIGNFLVDDVTVGVCTPPTAAPATIGGRITNPDGSPLGGASVHLSGAASRTTVTDSAGNYRFENMETDNFYSVSPSLANYSFSPPSRSFSLVGNVTDAGFTANPDATQSANAIDTVEYFVRQQYLDFLGREPDQGGLEYWAAQINQCGGDADCIRNRRIDVSAAFFASAEFQQTGSYVYGLYAGTLGRTLNHGEFSADRSQVLGGSGLDPAKTAFAQSFVQRAEFTNRYPVGMTREQFVDAVIQTMQVRSGMFMTSYRDGFLNDYDAGGRALVVRHAAEASEFVAAEYNKAFVLMEYFGYLRRDIDPGGYAFWLDVLNNGTPGNSRGMVCAFLTSTEYQHRFSTVVTHSNAECGQ